MKVRFLINKNRYRNAENADDHPLSWPLALFIRTDVQAAPNYCRELIQEVENAKRGVGEPFEGVGNSCFLSISPKGVYIKNEYDESLPAVELSLDQFKQVIEAWLKFIEGSGEPVEIEVK